MSRPSRGSVRALPAAAWDPATNPLALMVPDLDAYFDPAAVMTRHAGKGGMTMGTCVADSVRRTPQDLARAWLSMHHITNGHAILGIGSREAENTVPYGLPLRKPVARLQDVLGALRAAWAAGSQPLTHHGAFQDGNHATFALPSWRDSYPPVWVAAQGPRGAGIAGRYGDGWIHIHESFDQWEAGWAAADPAPAPLAATPTAWSAAC